MKITLIIALLIGGYFAYNHYYKDPMDHLKKDEIQLQIIKTEVQKSKKDAEVFEENQTKEYQRIKAINDEIKNEKSTTGVDFSPGNHILTI